MSRPDPTSFLAWPDELGDELVREDGTTAYLPAAYLRNEGVVGIFPASLDAVRAILPSEDLHPVRLGRGRAAVAVSAFLYLRWFYRTDRGARIVRAEPYGEVIVSPLCTHGGAAPPMLSLFDVPLPRRWRLAMFVQHMPVTSREALTAGRMVANFPKFVGDMEFVEDAEGTTVRLAEGEREILELRVQRRGRPRLLNDPSPYFTVRDGRLLRGDLAQQAAALVSARSGTASLRGLGQHPVADDLRALGIEDRSFGSQHFLSFSAMMGPSADVGPCRDHDGYRGTDREHGRLTVQYLGSDPIDLYAGQQPPTARTSTPTS
jgi:hypothetical protein